MLAGLFIGSHYLFASNGISDGPSGANKCSRPMKLPIELSKRASLMSSDGYMDRLMRCGPVILGFLGVAMLTS